MSTEIEILPQVHYLFWGCKSCVAGRYLLCFFRTSCDTFVQAVVGDGVLYVILAELYHVITLWQLVTFFAVKCGQFAHIPSSPFNDYLRISNYWQKVWGSVALSLPLQLKWIITNKFPMYDLIAKQSITIKSMYKFLGLFYTTTI